MAACSSFGAAQALDGGADASAIPDGIAAATTDADGEAPPGPCTKPSDARSFFCVDFEDARATSPFGFDRLHDPHSGSLEVVDAPGRPGKHALRVTLPQASASRNFTLVRRLPGPLAGHYTMEFDMNIEASSMTYARIGMLSFTSSTDASRPGVAAYNAGEQLAAGDAFQTWVAGKNGAWKRVLIDVRVADNLLDADVTVDGTTVQTIRGKAAPAETAVEVFLGAFYSGAEPGKMSVLIDHAVTVVR